MTLLPTFFEQNQPIIQFAYGLAFFVMGFAIALQSRGSSRLEISRSLRWLAAFGILHSLYIWGEFFSPVHEAYLLDNQIEILHTLHLFLLGISFCCLLEFGAVLIRPIWKARWLEYISPVWLGLYLLLILVVLPRYYPDAYTWHQLADAAARYLIGFPGGILAAYGLREQSRRLITPLVVPAVITILRTTGITLSFFAVLGGLIPPPIPLFPGNILNTQTFTQYIGVPPLVFLSALGVVLVVSVIRAVEIFQEETERRMELIEQQQILSAERERIGRELHDRTIQSAYTTGLLIDSARKLSPADSPISVRLDQAIKVLNEVIADLRRGMGELRGQPSSETLHEALQRLTTDPRFLSLVHITLDWNLAEADPLPPRDVSHVLAITYEALSNVIRHAHAAHVKITVRQSASALLLTLEDDGVGFPLAIQEGYGMRNIQERAQLLAGTVQIGNHPAGKGVRITLQIPTPTPIPVEKYP